jgi:hypothetical protein
MGGEEDAPSYSHGGRDDARRRRIKKVMGVSIREGEYKFWERYRSSCRGYWH